MGSPQFSLRIPLELDERLTEYAQQNGMTKTRVMLDALAQYLGCVEDVPLSRRMVEIEKKVAELEVMLNNNCAE